jgi:hypothetical protein
MSAFKLSEDDDTFLGLPQGALLVASGSDGAEIWIERCKATAVRVVVASPVNARLLKTVVYTHDLAWGPGPRQAQTLSSTVSV